MERRILLTRLVQAGGVVVAGVLGIPSLLAALSPVLQWRRTAAWQSVGRLDEFPVGAVRHAHVEVPRDDWSPTLREKGVYVWRPTADEIVVFSRNCTDLSCPVTWDPGSEWFFCPCHGGIFARNGDQMAGPPNRPLYRYANRIRNDLVEIDLSSLPPMT